MILQNLKRGTAFIFKFGGPVYIRVYGGFKATTGGPLHPCQGFEDCPVFIYNP